MDYSFDNISEAIRIVQRLNEVRDYPEEEQMTKRTMLARALFIAIMMVSFLMISGCSPQVVISPRMPNIVMDTRAVEQAVAPAAGMDAHFLTPTDFFFLEEPLENQAAWDIVFLGKIIQAPSRETDNQAQMLRVNDGASVWARWMAATTVATSADLSLGKTVVFYDANWGEQDIRHAPKSNQEARSGTWLISRITDTSELFKGYVLCGGGIRVSTKNIRVVVN